MATYRSRNALVGPLTPARILELEFPRGRRGYREDEVDALLDRFAYELHQRNRQLTLVRAENDRLKHALRTWQTTRARTPCT